MRIQNTSLSAALLAGAMLAAPAQAETVMTFKSAGVSMFNAENFNLSDGSIVQIIDVQYVSIGTDGDLADQTRSGFCYGIGRVSAEGVYAGEMRCEEVFSAEDSYTFDFTDNAEGGVAVVTGGKGKFKGATGEARSVYTWGDAVFGDRLTFTTEGTITLP